MLQPGLNCVITVPSASRKHASRTGPLRDFVVDNQKLYSLVIKHLRKCDKCDPREALQLYLDRRKRELSKFKGITSATLVLHAFKFKNVFKERGMPYPDDILHEIMWRIGTPEGLSDYVQGRRAHGVTVRLDPEGVVRGLILIKENDRQARYLTHNSVASLCNTSSVAPIVQQLAVIVDNMFTVDRPFPSKQELEELIAVADVMLS